MIVACMVVLGFFFAIKAAEESDFVIGRLEKFRYRRFFTDEAFAIGISQEQFNACSSLQLFRKLFWFLFEVFLAFFFTEEIDFTLKQS